MARNTEKNLRLIINQQIINIIKNTCLGKSKLIWNFKQQKKRNEKISLRSWMEYNFNEVNSQQEGKEDSMKTKFHDENCRSSCRRIAAVYRVVHPVRTILTSWNNFN